MRLEQLERCNDQSFNQKLQVIGLSLHDKLSANGLSPVGGLVVDIPFASHYFVIEAEGQLAKIFQSNLFRRQENISQLQFLVHEHKLNASEAEPEFFSHQQSEHALLATCLGVAILLYHVVPVKEVLRFAVAVAYHDSAAPVGRDTVIKLNRAELCEEKNFTRVMTEATMDKVFADIGFKTSEAQLLVYGHGMYGKLVDFVDKLSYTLLDAYHGLTKGLLVSTITACVQKNRLFGNVWLDVTLTTQGPSFFHARRLYYFLLIRSLLHDGLYKNPACRKLEVVYARAISDDLKHGRITCECLRRHDDHFLKTRYDHSLFVKKARRTRYRSFKEGDRALHFLESIGRRLVYMEETAPFNTCLNWLVNNGLATRALRHVLHARQVANLELLAKHRQGWHLYFQHK